MSVYIVMQIMKRQSVIDYKETIKTRHREVQCENFIHKWCVSLCNKRSTEHRLCNFASDTVFSCVQLSGIGEEFLHM